MKFPERGSSGFLAAGGVAAILASTCCLGPLILVLLGFSGAWIGNLTVLEPYRPFFLGLALVALILAALRLFRPTASCNADGYCAKPRTLRLQKIIFSAVVLVTVIGLVFP